MSVIPSAPCSYEIEPPSYEEATRHLININTVNSTAQTNQLNVNTSIPTDRYINLEPLPSALGQQPEENVESKICKYVIGIVIFIYLVTFLLRPFKY